MSKHIMFVIVAFMALTSAASAQHHHGRWHGGGYGPGYGRVVVQQPGIVYQQPGVVYQQPQVVYQQPVVQQPQVVYQQPGVVQAQPGGYVVPAGTQVATYQYYGWRNGRRVLMTQPGFVAGAGGTVVAVQPPQNAIAGAIAGGIGGLLGGFGF